jgi:hypothetical protein
LLRAARLKMLRKRGWFRQNEMESIRLGLKV